LVNQFTERYRTEERRNMRLREVMSLVIESLLLKKKIGRKKKRTPVRVFIDRRSPA
jgi:hypothetical protein